MREILLKQKFEEREEAIRLKLPPNEIIKINIEIIKIWETEND